MNKNVQLIPEAALDKHVALLGMTGAGKTSVIKVAIVEPDLAADRRVLIITPKDDWWGLRLSRTGKSTAYDIPIFGGRHADYPLNVKDAALLAEAYGTMKGSAIFCTTLLSVQDRARWFGDFAEAFLAKNRGWVRLVIDEAHVFMPKQGGQGGGAIPRALHAGNELVSQGRSLGLRIVLASQRSAKLHNDSLTQCSCLIAMLLMAPHDRDAVKAWIEDQADPVKGKEIIASLANQKPGQAWVWAPLAKMLENIQFPLPATFDSSAAPADDSPDAVVLKPVNLDALQGKLARIEGEKKAADPVELRREITRLSAEIALLRKAPIQDPNPTAIENARKEGFEQAEKKLRNAMKRELNRKLKEGLAAMKRHASDALDHIEDELQAIDASDAVLAIEFKPELMPRDVAAAIGKPRPAPSLAPQKAAPAKPVTLNADERPLGAERKPLAVLASIYPAGMTEGQWAVGAGLKRSGGTWSTYVSRLRSACRISEANGMFYASDQGMADIGQNFEPMPLPGPDLVQYWMGKINGVRPMLTVLAGRYPDWISREDLGEAINVAPSGGTFGTYLSRLRGPGLIETEGQNVRAAPSLMGGE